MTALTGQPGAEAGAETGKEHHDATVSQTKLEHIAEGETTSFCVTKDVHL